MFPFLIPLYLIFFIMDYTEVCSDFMYPISVTSSTGCFGIVCHSSNHLCLY